MPARCLLCREPFAICALTYEVDGGELCEACDATFAEPLRPSLGGAVAFLSRDDERREADPAPELLASPHALPLAIRGLAHPWPLTTRHPAHHTRVPAQRRSGPRSDSYFARLAE